MDPNTLALAAVEIISRLKDEMAKAHNRVLELEEQVAEKERCVQELTDSLMLRVIRARTQKRASG